MSSNLTSNYLQFKFAVGNGAKQKTYVFDEYRLDADKLMLYRRDEPVTLPPKVIKTLAVLVEDNGSILSKEDLIERIWDEAIVEESNLSQNLYLLRKTLGSRPDGRPYIETLRRRGYRFNGEVGLAARESGTTAVSTAPTATNARYAYQRHGNVVAVVDWQENGELPETVPPVFEIVPAATARLNRTWLHLLVIIGSIGIPLALIGSLVWLNSAGAVHSASGELLALETVQLTNGDDVTEATMARDGKYFVYHEADGEYARMVVQQTGQTTKLEVVPKGRRSIGSKSFSPDGQFIFYAAKEFDAPHWSIYRVPAMGGVSVRIVEDAIAHPSFSPDGKSMVFSRGDPPKRRSALVTSDASGGREQTILEGKEDFILGAYPAWSPDGKVIAYAGFHLTPQTPGVCRIYAYDVETGTSRDLSHEKWDACFRMEWRRDGKGLVIIGTKHGDGETTRRDQVYLISTATGVSQRLSSDPYRKQYSSLAVTDNNDVFCVPFNRASQIWAMDPAGSSKTAAAITTGSSDGKSGLVPLPDGRIAFVARTGENVGAWMINADGSERRQITSNPTTLEELRATPDGKYFFFASKSDDRNHLFRVDADGANLKPITAGDSMETDASVSPDGKWIVFGSSSPPAYARPVLMRTSIEGGTPTKISDQECTVPNYSPSGKYISCTADWDRILVISAEDGSVVRILDTTKVPVLNIGAKWTPDEKSLVYIASQKSTTNLWIQPIEGGRAQQLTDFPNGDIYNFAFSPDDKKLYLARGLQIHDAVLIKGIP